MNDKDKLEAKLYHSEPHPLHRKVGGFVSLGNPLDKLNDRPTIHANLTVRNRPFVLHNTTIYPDPFVLDAGIPYAVETVHSDGSSGISIVFAHSPGEALDVKRSDTVKSLRIIECHIYVAVPNDPE